MEERRAGMNRLVDALLCSSAVSRVFAGGDASRLPRMNDPIS